ncbi:hypothetical protein [Streptomyces sp. HUAS TT7]|uniref:hypothetical protein n=1 Tax=Streptomyces sp. HUAS TT7 TaxID=3447507 RepID=UPI003F659D54
MASFQAAAALYTPRIEWVRIPYEAPPGGLYRADTTRAPRPTLIMHSGFDGTAEELHFSDALAAVERGCTALTFDGPGQPGPRHHQGLVFRPDWEKVVIPVVDFAEGLPRGRSRHPLPPRRHASLPVPSPRLARRHPHRDLLRVTSEGVGRS